MQTLLERMEAQLVRWGTRIDQLAARSLSSFDALIHIDELKALRAIAQSKFDELRAAPEIERTELQVEAESAFNELGAALRDPVPPR